MGTMLDVLGGVLVFGVVILMALQLNVFTMEKNTQITLRSMTQEQVTGNEAGAGIGGILEVDLQKIGAGDSVSPSITLADADRFTFRGDVDGNGSVDSVRYYLTTPAPPPQGGNPKLKYFYRRQNTASGSKGWVGVTSVQFSYLDGMGRVLPVPVSAASLPLIRSVGVKMTLASNVRLKNDDDTTFAESYWETVISPVNVK